MLHRRTGTGEGSLSARPTGPPPNRASAPTANASYTPLKRRESANLYGQPSGSPASPRTPTYGNDNKARYTVPSPSPNGAAAGGAASYMDAKAYKRSSLTVVPGMGSAYGYGYTNEGGRGSLDLGDTYDAGVEDGPLPERLAKGVKLAFTHLRKGLEDSARLDRSWSLVWGDPELRKVVLKSSQSRRVVADECIMINLASLLLLSFAEVVVSPISKVQSSPSAITRTKEIGLWYNVLFSWPVFIVCFWINASWGPDISKRASTLLHPTYRHQPSPSLTPQRASDAGLYQSQSSSSASMINDTPALISTIVKSVRRILLIADFHLVGAALSYIPVVGYWLSFAYMCIITGSYCFEWTLTSKGLALEQRISYIQERTAYMIGFGFLATFVTSFSTTLVNMAIFALIYPFFVIQALLARPPLPRKSSLLPSTPSPGASVPPSPSPIDSPTLNPFFSSAAAPNGYNRRGSGSGKPNIAPIAYDLSTGRWAVRVPLFYMAGFAVKCLDWFVLAVMRDRVRGPSARDRGKRAF